MTTVLQHYRRHTLLHEIIMVGAIKPAIGVVIVEIDVPALSSGSSNVIMI